MAAKKSKRKQSRPSKADLEFVAEAEEILERMREDLANLSDQRAGNSEVDPDLVNSIFRSAHSMKGLAGLFGLETMSELAGVRLSTIMSSEAGSEMDQSLSNHQSIGSTNSRQSALVLPRSGASAAQSSGSSYTLGKGAVWK